MPARMKVTHCLLLSLIVVASLGAAAGRFTGARGDNDGGGADASSTGEDDPPPYTIVIDPGHGGRDLGTHGRAHDEKDLALRIALALGGRLGARPAGDVEVVYTRTEDVFVPLHERAAIANRAGADLFLSIHCNYLGEAGWHGSETYVMGLHTAEHNLDVAKRENAAVHLERGDAEAHYDLDLDSPMGHILLANFQHAYLERSLLVAEAIEASLGRRPGRRSRGVKQAGFVVLKETTMPSVLVELGYLSNAAEEDYLASAGGAEETAEALYAGVAQYLRELRAESGRGRATATGSIPVAARTPEERESLPVAGTPIVVAADGPGEEATDGVEFFVQLAAAARALDTSGEGWRKLGAEVRVLREAKLLKYQAGPFPALEEALSVSRTARGLGFDGAFAVGYRGGRRLSAAELEGTRR